MSSLHSLISLMILLSEIFAAGVHCKINTQYFQKFAFRLHLACLMGTFLQLLLA